MTFDEQSPTAQRTHASATASTELGGRRATFSNPGSTSAIFVMIAF